MANVDPFVIQWPSKWEQDPEIGPVVLYLNRFLHDLRERTGGGVDLIENLEVSQTTEDGGNRTNRFFRDEIDVLHGDIAQLKRQNRLLEQTVYELSELVAQFKRVSSLSEQKINELIERYDSGT